MADIELVVKIPEWKYKSICEGVEASKRCGVVGVDSYIHEAIYNGTPLPKGHGKLIDADELAKETKSYIRDTSNLHYDDLVEAEAYNSAYYNCLDEIEDALPIIEADKEQTNGNVD